MACPENASFQVSSKHTLKTPMFPKQVQILFEEYNTKVMIYLDVFRWSQLIVMSIDLMLV